MVLAAKAAAKHGLCSEACVKKICTVLEANALPTRCSDTQDALLPHMLHDKKRAGGTISLILPREIGRCEIWPMPVEELPALLKNSLS